MPAEKDTANEKPFDPTVVPEGWEWENVQTEAATKVIFDTVGDVFVGQFEGMVTVEPDNDDPFNLYNLRGADGELYCVNSSYSLETGFKNVTPGQWVRITYVKNVPSKKGNDMKSFRIDVRK